MADDEISVQIDLDAIDIDDLQSVSQVFEQVSPEDAAEMERAAAEGKKREIGFESAPDENLDANEEEAYVEEGYVEESPVEEVHVTEEEPQVRRTSGPHVQLPEPKVEDEHEDENKEGTGHHHHHYAYEQTIRFPETNLSQRGSDVAEDLKALTELPPTEVNSEQLCEEEDENDLDIDEDASVPVSTTVSLTSKIGDWLDERGMEIPCPPSLGIRKHFIRIINTLNYDEKCMEVANYQTILEIQNFYEEYNKNCREYVWKDIWGNKLEMNKSLGENGLVDNSAILDECGLDHFPTILLYFKDGFEDEPPLRLDISQPELTGLNAPCRNY